ncbi:MAG: hypothetical protein ABI824_06990 [Acidobacteriota bacterium]
MILLVAAVLLVAITVGFTLSIRASDMVPVPPVSPVRHLEDRRAVIYENLRDLQFEYLVGKLSDADYQQTKLGLQKELAGVLAEIDRVKKGGPERLATLAAEAAEAAEAPTVDAPATDAVAKPAVEDGATLCPHCGATFANPMKFCGECGKAMS